MTENNSNTETTATVETVEAVEAPVTYAAGSWQDTLAKSEAKAQTSKRADAAAGRLLWTGAQEAITDWIDNKYDSDEGAEGLAAEAQTALGGTHRKGDASKIKTVALAVKSEGLVLADYENLTRAYNEAIRLTKTVKVEASEDEAAEKATSKIEAPNTTATPEGAAKILMAAGLDEWARLSVEAVGAENHDAHRAMIRALTAEVQGRVKPKAQKAPKAGPKDGAVEVGDKTPAKPKATVKPSGAKVKAAPVKAAPVKAAPVKKGVPVKARPVVKKG